MAQQYSATDNRNGLSVTVTGDFPDDPEDRVRIARASNLFTRLMATMLVTEDPNERRERFKAIETQLEVAEALIRGDMSEVQRLIRETLASMGVSEEQLREVERELQRQLGELGRGDLADLGGLFGALGGTPPETESGPETEIPLDDQGLADGPRGDVTIEGLPEDLDPSASPPGAESDESPPASEAEPDEEPDPDRDPPSDSSR
jgi:hypothetical protein